MLLQSPFNNRPEKLNLHSAQRGLHYITIPAPSQCVSPYIRSPIFLNISAISWAAVASLSQQRATCPRLRLTLQMHWSTPSCFSVLSYPLSVSFDRLVNNAGGLCDDNRLGGKARTHKITHTHLFSFFFLYLSLYHFLVLLEFGSFQMCLNLLSDTSSPPPLLGELVIFTVHTFLTALIMYQHIDVQVYQVFCSPLGKALRSS